MRNIVYSCCILTTLLFKPVSWANRHEHFSSWPTASSIMDAYEETYGKSIGQVNINDLVFGEQEIKKNNPILHKKVFNYIYTLFPPEEQARIVKNLQIPSSLNKEDFSREVGLKLAGKNIDDVLRLSLDPKSSVTTNEQRKRFFKLRENSPVMKSNYLNVESMRNNLFLKLKRADPKFKKFILTTFADSIEKFPQKNRKFIGFSVPVSLYDSDLKELKDIFIKNGSTAQFYISIPRGKATQTSAKHQRKLSRLLEISILSIDDKWGNGMDITGSIYEYPEMANSENLEKQELLRKYLRTTVESLSGKKDAILRFHSFEAGNKGYFYDELFKVLDDTASGKLKLNGAPPVISIGHIAELTDEDIKKLAIIRDKAKANKIPYSIVFDANYESNFRLQGKSPAKLLKIIKKLDKAGFEVALGSDGTGILGNKSSAPNQMRKLLELGLTRGEAKRILQNTIKAPSCNINNTANLIEAAF